MSDNDSITGGFLDVVAGPDADAVLDVLHDQIVGLTGLDPHLVRPRWQPDPPKQPPPDTDWCAFGITGDAEEAAQLIHGDDSARVHSEDLLTVLVSFYGPRAGDMAKRLRRGSHVPSNRALLRQHCLALVEIGPATPAPDFVGGAWIRRIDLTMTIRQGTPSIAGVTPIRNLEAAPTIINGDTHE